ncbi:hypothetical protein Pmar_PMAR004167, partial [Perkinsus marinus ATCC 50983]
YAVFAIGCLLMPPLIRWIEFRSQIKFISFVGGFGYTFYLYVNTTTPSEDPGAASWVIYLIGATMVGLGAPLVWIPTLEMVSRSASENLGKPKAQQCIGEDADDAADRLLQNTICEGTNI